MSKLTLTEAVAVIPVSESTLRRDLKSGKVSFETDAKGRKQIDVSELTRVYGQLSTHGTPPETESAEPVNIPHQNPSMNGNDTEKVIALLKGQVQDLKAQLADATTEKTELLALANNLQKQNAVLMLPPPQEKHGWTSRLKHVFTRPRKIAKDTM